MREVLAVLEVEWRNTDSDSYCKSFLGGEVISGEGFRLYCKALVSEEMLGNQKKFLVGIGVTIFDSSGEIVVFKMHKSLVFTEISGEVAEMKALIEGHNNRTTIFCDDTAIYQYVYGKWV